MKPLREMMKLRDTLKERKLLKERMLEFNTSKDAFNSLIKYGILLLEKPCNCPPGQEKNMSKKYTLMNQ